MNKTNQTNEIVEEVRKNREKNLKRAKGEPTVLDKKGKALARKYGLKLSQRLPLELKDSDKAA